MSIKNIDHIVVLMLENRSFDSLLGWLYEHDASTANYLPNTPGHLFRGLQPPFNPEDFKNVALNGALSAIPTRGVKGFTVPDIDPGEEFDHVNTQFYGTKTPAPDIPATMKGVLEDFVGILKERGLKDAEIKQMANVCMETFTPGQLPVLNQLAKHYAVSDDWFASVPSQTNPNRSFLMCGTSNGMVNNGELETNPQAKKLESILGMAIGDDRVDAPTIFNALNEANVDWKVFWQTSYLPHKITNLLEGLPILIPLLIASGHPLLAAAAGAALALLKPYTDYLKDLTSDELKSCYTWRLFPQIKEKIPNAEQHFQKVEEFHRLAKAGQLPKFSYIEPFWSISHTTNPKLEELFSVQGNDYHPPGNTIIGEEFVKEVYTSLISNKKAWEKTLLLITFDEFVGTFDHVTGALKEGVVVPPWGPNGQPVYKSPTGFKFNRLGARVPTIVVSPYVQKQTVFRSNPGSVPFDHTSVIATTLKWLGQSERIKEFGERTKAAPSFEEVLTLNQARTDERDLAFLDAPRKDGDVVQYGDSFVLKNQNGRYLSSFYCTMKAAGGGAVMPVSVMGILVDLGLAAYFPTMGGDQRAKLTFLTPSADPEAQINNNTEVMLVTREAGVGAFNILGAWKDSHDCYYYNEYLYGDDAKKEKWIIQKKDNPSQPLRYGEKIYLSNTYFQGQQLKQDTRWFQSGWVTTDKKGDYWIVEPSKVEVPVVDNSWNKAPDLMIVAASQQGGSRGAQLWGVDMDGQMRSTFQETPGGNWSGWSGAWAGSVFPAKLISVAAAQQNNGVVRIWAIDQSNALYSNTQISPGSDWSGWSTAGWSGAPPLQLVAASQQGGTRGAQLWGIDMNGQLRSTYQVSPGGAWSAWSEVWNGSSPANLISIAAAQQNNGVVRIWVIDANNALYSNAQTSPGGDWTGWSSAGWSGAPPLRSVAASQQGGSRGAQLWGIDMNGQLRSTYQETPGGNWSSWSGVWNGSSPANLISVAAAQQNDGKVRIWVVDANRILYSNAQTSPGGNWTGWSPKV